MKIQSYLILPILFTVFFSFHSPGRHDVSCVPCITEARAGITSTFQEASNTVKELKSAAEGAGRFFSAVSSVISALTSFAGWRAFVLLFGVILISAVLTFIGIPRGGISFLISLAVADWIWVLWAKSFTPDAPVQYAPLIQANAVLLLPLAVVMVIKKILPRIGAKIGAGAGFIFTLPFLKKRSAPKRLLLQKLGKYNGASARLQQRLLEDIMNSEGDRVVLSGDTVEHMDEITRVLKEIQEAGQTGGRGSRKKNDMKDGE